MISAKEVSNHLLFNGFLGAFLGLGIIIVSPVDTLQAFALNIASLTIFFFVSALDALVFLFLFIINSTVPSWAFQVTSVVFYLIAPLTTGTVSDSWSLTFAAS